MNDGASTNAGESKWTLRLAVALSAILASVFFAAAARADNLSINAGAGEFMGIPFSHAGVYGYAGPGYTKSFSGWSWSSALVFEISPHPELGRLGLSGWSTIDLELSEAWYLNAGLAVMHDQPGFRFKESAFFVGPTLGATRNLADGYFISPCFSLFYGLSDAQWWIFPMLNVGRGF